MTLMKNITIKSITINGEYIDTTGVGIELFTPEYDTSTLTVRHLDGSTVVYELHYTDIKLEDGRTINHIYYADWEGPNEDGDYSVSYIFPKAVELPQPKSIRFDPCPQCGGTGIIESPEGKRTRTIT